MNFIKNALIMPSWSRQKMDEKYIDSERTSQERLLRNNITEAQKPSDRKRRILKIFTIYDVKIPPQSEN